MSLVLNSEPTFYAVNGKSVIQLTIITDKLTDLCYTQNTDTEIELLTGYPAGDTFLSSVSSKLQIRPQHTNEKWPGKHRLEGLENHIGWKDDSSGQSEAPIYNDVYTAWYNIRNQTNREHIPNKINIKHSKPFRNKTLTELSLNSGRWKIVNRTSHRQIWPR